jgi:hypothetical protein
MQLARGHHVIANRFDQRSQQLAGCADSSGQSRSVEVHALAGVDLRLPVKRKVVRILRDQPMSQQPRACKATIHGP